MVTKIIRSCHRVNEEGSTSTAPSHAPRVQIHPFSFGNENDGLIVKIQPPREPGDANLRHVPCDLVLSIDVSGSMDSPAPAPSKEGEPDEEDAGLSVLDLVKHAARTIVETLDENDRLGIVTFSLHSEVLQELTPMTDENKAATLEKIKAMKPEDTTNLWHGVRDGLGLFDQGSPSRVPALLVMTDGLPNTCHPSRGYVPSLQTMMPFPATIHTFGFGYSLKSGLLKSISEIGGGNYSFIPDAGMLGTVFIHAVANLQSTFATNAKLRLTYPGYLKLEETTGQSVVREEPVYIQGDVPEPLVSLAIPLGNLQYGQSRDIYLRYGDPVSAIQAKAAGGSVNPYPLVTAILEHQELTPTTHQTVAHQNLFGFCPSALDPAEIAYHISRSAIIAFLSTFFPLNAELEHKAPKSVPPNTAKRLRSLLANLPAARPEFASHAGCRSLMNDLRGPLPAHMSEPDEESSDANMDPSTWTAQIPLALLGHAESPIPHYSQPHFPRWGAHFLPALAGAHARQICHSFKDPGPLQYGVDSPLFKRCRDRLDEVFDTLPPPEGSRVGRKVPKPPSYTPPVGPADGNGNGGGNWNGNSNTVVSMRSYNDSSRGCFAGCMGVLLADGKVVRVGKLRKGMEVITPRGPRKVQALLRMPVREIGMCLVPGHSGGPVDAKGDSQRKTALLVTPWHPVTTNPAGPWVFPKDLAVRSVRYTGAVYSVLLERDDDPDAHAILVGGVWGVAMGHGLTQTGTQDDDVRAHQFYGDYDKVSRALAKLPMRSGGVMMGGELTRDAETGLVNGFKTVKVEAVKRGTQKKRGGVSVRV